jgi:hypothetical protein
MFYNEDELQDMENVLKAIENISFNKLHNLDGKIEFECFLENYVRPEERERNIVWNLLLDILQSPKFKKDMKKTAHAMFKDSVSVDITEAFKNLHIAEDLLKEGN